MENNIEECGNVIVSVLKDVKTGFNFFKVKTDCEDLLPISYIIEDTLKLY